MVVAEALPLFDPFKDCEDDDDADDGGDEAEGGGRFRGRGELAPFVEVDELEPALVRLDDDGEGDEDDLPPRLLIFTEFAAETW